MTAAKAQAKENAAQEAAVSEVEEDTHVSFEYEGNSYTVDKSDLEDNLEVLEAFEDGKIITPIKLLLGDKQWLQFKLRHKPNAAKLNDFGDLMFKAMGIDLGEWSG